MQMHAISPGGTYTAMQGRVEGQVHEGVLPRAQEVSLGPPGLPRGVLGVGGGAGSLGLTVVSPGLHAGTPRGPCWSRELDSNKPCSPMWAGQVQDPELVLCEIAQWTELDMSRVGSG